MIGRVYRWLSSAIDDTDGETAHPPRLTEDEARQFADEAAVGLPMAEWLVANGRPIEKGRAIGEFWTPTRGSNLTVYVDDATGDATVEQFHGR